MTDKPSTLIEYHNAINKVRKIVNMAKENIIANHNKITDWSELDILLIGNSGIINNTELSKKDRVWYGKSEFRFGKFITKRELVKTISFVLDEIDYDLSVTINDKIWFWINDASVITIWDFIEERV